MNKKAGLVFKFLVIVAIVIAIFIACSKFSKAETLTDIINVTLNVNSTDIVVNVSNNIYVVNNTASIVSIQQNFSVFYAVNITNQTIISNITCSNASISLSCSCPSCPSLPSVLNASCDEVNLKNETKTELYNHYVTNLGNKIEESSNKIAQDIVFKLEPTKVQLDACKDTAFNASIRQNEAERQRDEQVKNNQVITGFFESCKNDQRTMRAIFTSLLVVVAVAIMFFSGAFERFGSLFGGGRF